jgi:hypothetical protein
MFAQMSRSVRTALVMLSFALLSACATSVKEVGNERPAWIDNPGNGVSASAGMHVRGRAAQEELAILRAREEFAKRFGVSIRSAQTLHDRVARPGKHRRLAAGAEDTQQVDVKPWSRRNARSDNML